MDAVVKEEEDSVNEERNMVELKKEVEDTVELKEPKVELIDEMDVKKEEIDEDEYQHMIPYEYRDYVEQHGEKEPGNSRKRQAEQESPHEKKTAECQVCRKTIVISSIIKHVATHTKIKRSSCPVDECEYKSDVHQNVIKHMKQKHKMDKPNTKDVVKRELSDDEKEELRKVVEDCFPEMTKRRTNPNALYKFDCQLCNGSISELGYRVTSGRRNHAFTHTDIMLYECIKPECNFKTKYFESFRKHQTTKHDKTAEMIKNVKRKLPPEEVLKIKEMINQCFPELKELAGITQHKEKVQSSNLSKKCNICHRTLHINDLESKNFRRFHALSHTDIMLYKCCKEDCDYKAPNRYSITNHQKWMHKMNMHDMPVIQIELTNEQEMEIERMMVQCFPEWEV